MAIPITAYQDVIDWAISQQHYETANGQPAPLMPSQRKALLELHKLIKPAIPISEPELGDTNWVGIINQFRQAHPGPSGTVAEFYEKRIEGPVAGQPRWAYSVALDEHNERFPPETTQGLVQSFARKKDAKQFAAKCAVQWLMDQKLMPSTVKDADIPKQQVTTVVSPPPKRQKVNATSPSSTPLTASANISAVESAQSATVSGQGQPSKGTRSRENRTPSPTSAGKEAAKLVAELCTKLGVMPPTYKIELEQGEFGSGHAQFHDPVHPQEVPRVLGHVSGVYGGKKNVKEAIAEQILKELRLLEEKRDAMLDELLATGGKS